MRAEADELRALASWQTEVTFGASERWYPGVGRKPSRSPLVGWAGPAYSDVEQAVFALHDRLDFEAATRLARSTGDAFAYLKHLTVKHGVTGQVGDLHRFAAPVRAFRAESAHLTLRSTALTDWLEDHWDREESRPIEEHGAFVLDSYLKLLLVHHRLQIGPSAGPVEAVQKALAAEAHTLVTDSHRLAAWARVTAVWMESEIHRRTAARQVTADRTAGNHRASGSTAT